MTESKRRQSESMISSGGRPSRRSWRSTSSCSSSGSLHFRLVSIMRRLIVGLRDPFEGSRPKAIGSPLGLHLPHMHAEQPVHEELAHEAMPCKQYCDNAKLNMHSIHIQMRTVQHIVCHPSSHIQNRHRRSGSSTFRRCHKSGADYPYCILAATS